MNIYQYAKNPLTGAKLLDLAKGVIAENDHILIGILEQQWTDGQDKYGRVLGRYKKRTQEIAEAYQPHPRKEKIQGRPYNLDWTGDLINKLVIDVKKTDRDLKIRTDSFSKNKIKLYTVIKRYGDINDPEKSVIGYQEENLKKFRVFVGEEIKIKAKQKYGVQL